MTAFRAFRMVASKQVKRKLLAHLDWQWFAIGFDGRYLKGFNEKLVPCGWYRISRAPKTGRFIVGPYDYSLRVRKGSGWRLVSCPSFCSYGMRELGIEPGRAFNVIPVRRGK